MKSTIKNVLRATLALVCVAMFMVGCDSSTKNNSTTPEPPQGNQAPRRLAEEPAEKFTYQFMNVEQLYSRFEKESEYNGVVRAGVEFDQGGIVITAYHGELSKVKLPDTIEGFPIVAIDRNAFPLAVVENEEVTVMPVTDVFFPPTVRVFEFGAVEVRGEPPREVPADLPNSITVPYGVTHLVYHSRSGASRDVFAAIRSIELPDTLVDIPEQMFEKLTSLTGITIPNSVERIGTKAFDGATSLLRIDFPTNIDDVAPDAFDGTSWLTAQPDGIIYVGRVAFGWSGAAPSDGKLSIREGITVISDRAFSGLELTDITIPDSVTQIGSHAFADNRMTSVTIPDSVTRIGSYAFADTQLTSVSIGNSVTEIEFRAFENTQLESVIIPDSVTKIGGGAFENSQLTSVSIGNSVTDIESSAFENTQLTSVIIPDSVTSIGTGVFNGTPLNSVVIGDGITSINDSMFKGLPLTGVTFGNNITQIGDEAFMDTQLTSVIIGDSVTHIGRSAFENALLTSIVIPDSVIDVGYSAFDKAPLTAMEFGEDTEFSDSIFDTVKNIADDAKGKRRMELRSSGSGDHVRFRHIFESFPQLASVTVGDTHIMFDLFKQLILTKEDFNLIAIEGHPAILLSAKEIADAKAKGLSFDTKLSYRNKIWGYVEEYEDGYVFVVHSVD